MDWDKLKIFHTVAEASSFTKASTILNLSQSAISRQIQALESDLKVQLFERHARGLVLTENGEYLYKSAHEIISKLKNAINEISYVQQKNLNIYTDKNPDWMEISDKQDEYMLMVRNCTETIKEDKPAEVPFEIAKKTPPK